MVGNLGSRGVLQAYVENPTANIERLLERRTCKGVLAKLGSARNTPIGTRHPTRVSGSPMDNDLKLTSALDRRIRAVLEETLRGRFAHELRNLVHAEMMGALGIAGQRNTIGAPKARLGRPPKAMMMRDGGATSCNVFGCGGPLRSRGYCSAHYQAARRYSWPMPAPASFEPPIRERARRA